MLSRRVTSNLSDPGPQSAPLCGKLDEIRYPQFAAPVTKTFHRHTRVFAHPSLIQCIMLHLKAANEPHCTISGVPLRRHGETDT